MESIEVITDGIRITPDKDNPETVQVTLSSEASGGIGIMVSGESMLIVSSAALREILA